MLHSLFYDSHLFVLYCLYSILYTCYKNCSSLYCSVHSSLQLTALLRHHIILQVPQLIPQQQLCSHSKNNWSEITNEINIDCSNGINPIFALISLHKLNSKQTTTKKQHSFMHSVDQLATLNYDWFWINLVHSVEYSLSQVCLANKLYGMFKIFTSNISAF